MENAAQRLVIALDDMREDKIHSVIEQTRTFATTYKIGLALFVAHGPKIMREISSLGADIFLDLKLHDIPMQVSNAVKNALNYSPRFLTVHAQGGREMLKAAANEARFLSTKLLAVTMLTSLAEVHVQELGYKTPLEKQVLKLAELAISSGIDGLVTSPKELSLLRKYFGNDVYLVTPGIRAICDHAHDQARTLDAYQAIRKGADALVVGRPITQAENYLLKAKSIHADIERGIKDNMANVTELTYET